MSDPGTLSEIANAGITIGGHPILWREIVGNLFGMASAVGGMRRRVWAWPVGIAGNVLLFTVFLGAAFDTPQGQNLWGQAGRQVMFVAVSVYGWWRWHDRARAREAATGDHDAPAVRPRWAAPREKLLMAVAAVIAVTVLTPLFSALGSFPPVWADAWIFTGSFLATYAMARGWVDFWLIWIAVDVVGVPLLWHAHLFPSAVLYLVYAGFVLWGFVVWLAAARGDAPLVADEKAQVPA